MKTRPVFATSRKADEAAPDPSDVNVGAKGGTLTMDELLQRQAARSSIELRYTILSEKEIQAYVGVFLEHLRSDE